MISEIILRKKPVHVLFQIFTKDKPEMALSITRKTKITHAHVVKLMEVFHKNGLISKEKKGRVVMLTLTKKGLEVGTELKALHKILNDIDKKDSNHFESS